MHHFLKITTNHFEAVASGFKKAEVRDNTDRGFQKGDIVTLDEIHGNGLYTGRKQLIEITYVSDYNQPRNQVVFSFSLCGDDDVEPGQ